VKAGRRIAIGEVCSFLNGGTPSKSVEQYFQGDIPWITGADITSPMVTNARSFITKKAVESSATNCVPAGTVLLVTRTSVGKVATAGVDLCFSQDITALTPDPSRLHAPFLVEFLKTQETHFERQARGATIKGITRQVVSDLEIPLPPLAEQRRIAEVLDRAEALRAKRRATLAQLDSLTQSLFLDLFGDPATNPKGWPIRRIGDLLESASYGTSEKSGATGEFPVLRMNNITRTGEMDFTDLKFMDLGASHRDRYLVRTGDVLFNRTNSADLVGKTGIFRETKPVAYAGYLIRLRVNNENDPEFLSTFLNTGYSKRMLRGMCKSIIGMANINATEIQAMRIPQPPLPLQREFARRVQAVEKLKTTQRASLAELDALFATLQHRAFRGKL
jgi:type I restriction enzyme, S subunit